MVRWFGAAAAIAILAGCSGGAREVDYTPERGISADIAAAHPGVSSLYPGISSTQDSDEPMGALPWEVGERHQE
ncbi:MAG TPA: hypothetical protein VE397_11910 [Stellaceae bacterium]|jgi:hypothetical protein|nr:hypothetical protein [Stellaceae bacterium]